MTYWPPPGRREARFLGHEIEPQMLTPWHRRACPECLKSSPYHRAFWDLWSATGCPIHGRTLIDRCPACGTRLGWHAVPLWACGCGQDLREGFGMALNPQELVAIQEQARLLNAMPDVSPPRSPLPGYGADVGESLQLLAELGWLLQRRQGTPHYGELARRSQGLSQVAAGFEAVRDWPTAFHHYIELCEAPPPAFDALADWLTRLSPTPIRTAMEEAVDQCLRQRITEPLPRFEPPRIADHIPVREAARMLGKQVGTTLRALKLHGLAHESADQSTSVDKAGVEALRAELRELCDRERLAVELACSLTDANAIGSSGLVHSPSPAAERLPDGGAGAGRKSVNWFRRSKHDAPGFKLAPTTTSLSLQHS